MWKSLENEKLRIVEWLRTIEAITGSWGSEAENTYVLERFERDWQNMPDVLWTPVKSYIWDRFHRDDSTLNELDKVDDVRLERQRG